MAKFQGMSRAQLKNEDALAFKNMAIAAEERDIEDLRASSSSTFANRYAIFLEIADKNEYAATLSAAHIDAIFASYNNKFVDSQNRLGEKRVLLTDDHFATDVKNGIGKSIELYREKLESKGVSLERPSPGKSLG